MSVDALTNKVPSPDMAAVLDTLSTSVICLNNNRISYLNLSAEHLFGVSRTRASNHELSMLFAQTKALDDLCQHVSEGLGSVALREVELIIPGNAQQIHRVDVIGSPLEPDAVLLEIRDVEDRLRIERDAALNQQNSVSRLIIRQLAHEIKNPLGGLRGAAQLLSRRLPSADLQEYTDVIIHETDRLVTLVDTMLGPTSPTHRNWLNVHKVLDHVRKLLGAEAEQGVSFYSDYDPSLPEVLADEGQLTQAVLNLARNAMQAVGEKGKVIFRSRADSGVTIGDTRHPLVVRIDIEDTGPGVPKDMEEQIFYPLVSDKVNGAGLGLAVSQELIHRHGGLIKLGNEHPTVFSIYLPVDLESK